MIIVSRKRFYGAAEILNYLKEGRYLCNCSISLFFKQIKKYSGAEIFGLKFHFDQEKRPNEQVIYITNNQFLRQFDGFAN